MPQPKKGANGALSEASVIARRTSSETKKRIVINVPGRELGRDELEAETNNRPDGQREKGGHFRLEPAIWGR